MKEFRLPLKGATHKSQCLIFTFLPSGWEILNPPQVGGRSDEHGYNDHGNVLETCFVQDGMFSVPKNIDTIMYNLWNEINDGTSDMIIQDKFNELGKIIVQLHNDLSKFSY